MSVKPIPDDYPQVIPYLHVEDAAKEIEFIQAVFGAKERMRMGGPDGKIGHCELELGKSMIMLSDMGEPKPGGAGSPVGISLYVEDVDAAFDKAVGLGAEAKSKPEDQFYGDRSAQFIDPQGHLWYVATHVEDVSEADMQARMAAMMSAGG
jgi:PhnB protein